MSAGQQNEPSLRDSLTAAFDAGSTPDSPPSMPSGGDRSTAAPAPAAPATPTGQPGAPAGPAGAVGADPTKAAAPAAKPGEPAAAAPKAADPNAKPAEAPTAIKPPVNFPDMRVWQSLDDKTKGWIRDREVQFNKGIQRYANSAKFGDEIANELRPYEAAIRSSNVSPTQLVRELAATFYLLTQGSPEQKAQAFQRAARKHGVDLRAVANGQQSQQPEQVPERFAQLERTVQEIGRFIQGREQSQGREIATQAWQEVDSFARNPQHEHIDVLWPVMATLLEGGHAQDLAAAYDQALWSRPDLRAIQVERDAAQRARAAGNEQRASTAGGGAPSAASVVPSNESLRGALERAWSAGAA